MEIQNKQGYKQTEVGLIPEEWEVERLESLTLKIGSGITPTGGSSVYKQEGRPFLRSQNVGWGNLLLDDIVFIDEQTHLAFPSTEIKLGDVFLNITGASIGRSSYASKHVLGGNVNQHVCIIRPQQEKLNSLFLNHFLLSDRGQKQIDSFQSGGNRQGLNFGQIKTFLIPLPPLPEQTAIASALSDMDALIAQTEKLIEKKKAIKQGVMQELLTGKKRLKGFENSKGYKQTEVGVIPEDWEIFKIGEVSSITTGGSDTQDRKDEGEFPFFVRSQKVERINRFSMDCEAILTSGDGVGVGKIFHYIVGKFDFHQRVYCIYNFSSNTNGKYLFYQFSTGFNNRVMSLTAKSSVDSVRREMISEMKIPFPNSLQEQKAIASAVSDLEQELELFETKLQKLKLQKQGMMQVLLTGKIRLV